MAVDVAVVGAGPSGAWVAYRLARGGARVALIDGSHPREKPCGGGVTGRALAIVDDAIDTATLPAVRIRAARFLDSRGGVSATVPLAGCGGGDALVVASRACFDGTLLEAARKAGAAWHPVRAVDLEPTGGSFRICLADGAAVDAAFVIGADGANSLVRRRMTMPFTRGQLSIATGYYAHGISSDNIVIEFVDDPAGYIWSFPRADHLAIGICAGADAGATAGRLRERTLRWMRAAEVGLAERLTPYSWPIPSLSAADFERLPLAGDGWCLVGDAAGLVDPITREGIFFALRSADFAAEAVLDDPRPAPAGYAARVRDEIVGELARAARLKDAFFQPRFTGLLMAALVDSAPIRRVMGDLIAGTQGYRDLKWRLAKTREIGYALKALGIR